MAVVIPAAVIGAAAAAEVKSIFGDAGRAIQVGEAQYLVDGEPSSISGAISQAAGRSACRIYGSGAVDISDAAAERYERTCRPYLDTIDPLAGAGISVPFEGGQCDGEGYRVQYLDEGDGNPLSGITASGKTRGPIAGVRFATEGTQFRGFITSRSVVGNFTCAQSGPTLGPLQERPWFTVTNRGYGGGSFSITQACGADTCGNPEPVVKPPSPIPNPTGPTFRFNPSPDINIDLGVELFPDGTIAIDIGTGPITINPFEGNDDGGGGGGGGGGDEPGEAGEGTETGTGGEGGEGGEAEGDAPEGKVLTGVRIDIVSAPGSRTRYTSEVDRGVAYVYMGFPAEGLGLEPTGSLVRDGQFFFAQKNYLTRWAVRAKVGYNLSVTPYYKDAPE